MYVPPFLLFDISTASADHFYRKDHHGDPSDFPNAAFLVGDGALKVLAEGLGGVASHQHFDPNLLPTERTHEFPSTTAGHWAPLVPFPHTLDLLGDGSLYIIDAPGHLPGHVNLLARLGPKRWVYLAGDSAHDVRLLTGEREVGTWLDDHGRQCCIHLDKPKAEETIRRIRDLVKQEGEKVEVICAHDEKWRDRNLRSFYPGTLS